jgi:hypothetical protein
MMPTTRQPQRQGRTLPTVGEEAVQVVAALVVTAAVVLAVAAAALVVAALGAG